MNVQVSRQEIKEQAALLAQLEHWEFFRTITREYSTGTITLAYESKTIHQGICQVSRSQPCIEQTLRQIAAKHTLAIIEESIEAIKKALPIPLSE